MGKGHPTRVRHTRAAAVRPPEPPRGEEAARLLTRVRTELAKQRAGGAVFQPSAAERRVLEWLAYESGADMEMDRDPRHMKAYAFVERGRPQVLKAIQDPASTIERLSYPLDTSDVVDLLRKAGLRVDPVGTAVRRLADKFKVPKLGSGQRRTFFARHVLEIASALILDVNPQEIEDLGRHLALDLTEKEQVIAPMIPAVPHDQAIALATRSTLALAVGPIDLEDHAR